MIAPENIAALVWAAGTLPATLHTMRLALGMVEADPLRLCDDCREKRRRGNTMINALPIYLVAPMFILVGMAWPVLAPVRLVKHVTGRLHRCDRYRQAAPSSPSEGTMMDRVFEVEIDGRLFAACGKPDCERVVSRSVVYCCTPCSRAAEHRYEIDQHTAGCEQRWEERRPYVTRAREGRQT